MAWEPTHLHLSEGRTRLCGEKDRAWPEHCMDDKWARKLPLCPKCIEIRKSKTDTPVGITPEAKPIIQPARKETLFLVDYGLSLIMEHQESSEETV